jgi:hypothetical protein
VTSGARVDQARWPVTSGLRWEALDAEPVGAGPCPQVANSRGSGDAAR